MATATGCIDQVPTQPSADVIIVHVVLDAGTSDQFVVVQTTTGAVQQQTAVAGAMVTLALPDGRVVTAIEDHDSTVAQPRFGEPTIGVVYFFALGAAGISLQPGGTYALRIELPDQRLVTGMTTIPNAVAVADGDRASQSFDLRDTLRLEWRRVPGARSYEVRVESKRQTFALFTDTSVALTQFSKSGSDNALVPGISNELVVSAVDANYYDYYRHPPDAFTGNGIINHLVGGIGVFGSIVELDRRTLAVH